MVGDRVSNWTLHKLGWWAPNKQRHVQLYDDGMGGRWAKVGRCWMQPSRCHLHMWNSVSRTPNFIIQFYCGKYYCLCYLFFVKDIFNSNILTRSLWYLKIYNDINIVYMYTNDVAQLQLFQIFVFVIKQSILQKLQFLKFTIFAVVV